MYGTVARFKAQPGAEEKLREMEQEYTQANVPGALFTVIYRMDNDPNEFYMATVFESKEAYIANANSPEQNARYMRLMEVMTEEPQWHDGEVVSHTVYE